MNKSYVWLFILPYLTPIYGDKNDYCLGIAEADTNTCECVKVAKFNSKINKISCPKGIPSQIDIEINFYPLQQLVINCHGNYNSLKLIPELKKNYKNNFNYNLQVIRQIEFANCYDPDQYQINNYNYNYGNLNEILIRLQLNISSNIYLKFTNERQNSTAQAINSEKFFENLQFDGIKNLVLENFVLYSATADQLVLNKLNYCAKITLHNCDEINFDKFREHKINDGHLAFLEIDNSVVNNFNQNNLKKFGNNLLVIKLQKSKINETDFNMDHLFEYCNRLEYFVMDTNFETIEFNEFIFANLINLKVLALKNEGIEKLHRNIFANLMQLQQISLERNRLKFLDRSIFRNNKNLNQIDLSFNQFVEFEDTSIFNLPLLSYLDLNNNQLKAFATNFTSGLRQIDLNSNKITYDEFISTCPFYGLNSFVVKIFLSQNNITTIDGLLNCYADVPGLALLDLSHNQINVVNFKKLRHDKIRLKLGSTLILKNNNVKWIDMLDDIDWNSYNYEYRISHIIMNLDSNPLFCENCALLAKTTKYPFIFLPTTNDITVSITHPHICKNSAYCDVEEFYDRSYKCPSPCTCNYNEFSKHLQVMCAAKSLTEAPIINAETLINVNSVEFNLRGNLIKNFTLDGQPKDILSKLKSINLEGNRLESFDLSTKFPLNIEELLLAENRLHGIETTTLKFMNFRDKNLNVTLASNFICRKDTERNYEFNLVDRDTLNCVKYSEDVAKLHQAIDERIGNENSSNFLKLLIVVVFIILILVFIGFVYIKNNKEALEWRRWTNSITRTRASSNINLVDDN